MKKITLLIAFMLSFITMGYGQTVLINPTGDGGFATGSTFVANGWTVANSANNPWVIGTAAASGALTGNVAYVSNDAGATTNYSNGVAAVNYFYRDITVPAGETRIVLTFNWSGTGEDNWDQWQVLTAATTVTPTASTSSTSSFTTTLVPTGVTGATSVGFGTPQTGVQTATYALPASLAGTTFRLIFSWRDDTSGGSSPASAIDNISLTSTVPFNSIASGNWNNPAIWNKGVVPSCTDEVNITGGFNVTVNSAANTCKNVTIASGSTLTLSSGSLTAGCTGFNNPFTNNGTLTVSGGTLNVNGNMLHASGSTFNQSGGDINVDGNDAGGVTFSVPVSTAIVQINTNLINWTGGNLTLVDPHASATSTYAFQYNGANVNVNSGTHTIIFGNGTSTDAGGSTSYGFRYYVNQGAGRLTFNNMIVNAGAGTNRFVTNGGTHGINGDLTVNASSQFRDSGNTVYLAKNLVNNGTFVSTGTAYFGTFLNGTSGAATNAQAISGTGVFANATSSPTANFTGITVNNSSASGVTFAGTSNIASQPANSVSVSGTLTFTSGKIATTGGASFILGNSSPSAGTLSYTAGGFVSGTTFGRWFTATGTGTTITAAADATGAAGRYPFVNASNLDRSASIERNTPAAAAGVLAVTYTAASGYSTISATDGATAIDRKGNDTWAVSVLSGTPTAAASLELQLLGSGTFAAPLNAASTRIIQGAAFAGTHQAGTVTPGGQRLLSPAEIVAGAFSIAASSADLPLVSVASGDWNTPGTWSTGVVPVCTDVVNIAAGHTVTVTTAGAVSKNLNIVGGGTLTVSAGDLTVGCTSKNNIFTNNGTLMVSGGTVNVNGNMLHVSGSTFNQSGGNINVDGNDAGAAATSVASGTAIVQINTNLLSWTGGTLTVVDPHANSTASNSFTFNNSTANVDITAGHTLRFGDGVSTDAGGDATNGFRMSTFAGSNKITLNNVIVNGGTGTNRFVSTTYAFGVNGDLTVNANSQFRDNGVVMYIARNLVNNGTYVATGTLYFGTFLNNVAAASANAQTLSGTGTFANLAASPTANLTSMTVNNSNAAGVTLSKPLSISGTLTLTAGQVVTTTANILTLGTATAAGTLSGGSATAYISGPFARTIASGNANTSYITFPVGKAAYAPVFLAPTTTAVTVMKAEAFDTNAGTADPGIINLPATRRWEAPVVSGTVTDVKVRLGDTNITNVKIPVMAPTAAGIYNSSFGSTATYAAGTPNTIQGLNAIPVASYTGFLSFAESNVCSGTPAPGNTIASANNICLGSSVTLSVQNNTSGTGVTYQWQSSVNGTTFTDIASATAATYTVTPSAVLYYRLNVTCSTGPVTGASTPVQVTFSNAVASNTPGARCGVGTVNLSATGSAGTTVKWYAAATGGTALGTGTTFTTPSIVATTTYYAGAISATPGTATIGTATTTTTATEELTAFSNRRVTYKSQTIYTAAELAAAGIQAGNIVSIAYNITTIGDAASNANYTVKMGTTTNGTFANTTYLAEDTFTTVFGPATYTHAVGLNTVTFTTPFSWDGTSNIVISVSHSGIDNINNAQTLYTDLSANTTLYNFDNLTATTGTSTTKRLNVTFGGQIGCSSARVPVVATVNTPPTITLSTAPAAICAGQTTTAVTITAGAASYDTYVWTPSTGVSGNPTTGWTFNPTTTTTYSLSASQSTGSFCAAPAIPVVITVNPLPSVISTAATVSVCQGTSQALTASGGVVTTNVFQDNFDVLSTNFVTASTAGTAAATLNTTYAAQGAGSVLFTTASTSANLSYNLNSNLNLTGYDGAQLTFSHIAAMEGPSTSWDIGFVEYSADGGTTWVTFPASSYAGSGSLITLQGTTVAVDGAIFSTKSYADWIATFSAAAALPNNSLWKTETINIPAAALTNQFRIRFRYTNDTSANYYGWLIDNLSVKGLKSNAVWSPNTELYTDAAATIPYTGQVSATVYTKPTAARTYTITSANTTTGCSVTANTNVTINVVAAPTVPAPAQDVCNAGTVANLVATGTGIKWYAASSGGAALANTVALVNGTTYYASQTVSGCESVARTALAVNINVVAAPAIANAAQTFCNAGTVAELLPNGAAIKWYAAATGGTALASTAALVNGTTYYASQTVNGCEGLVRGAVTATVNVIAAPAISNNEQVFCNAATVADLLPNGAEIKWYTAATGGTALATTAALVSGTTYYASQTVNGCEGLLRGTVTATVLVTPAPVINNTDQVFCNAATVAELLPNDASIKWYAAATGGTALASTDALVSGTHYFASQTVDGCEGLVRTDVMATVNVTATPTADNEQEFCTSAIVDNLVAQGNAIVWYAEETGGTALAGDAALTNGTMYYAAQVVAGCESLGRFGVTAVIHTVVVDAPADVDVCTEYVLPALTSGAYFTQTGGQGIELAAGSVITETVTLYVYAQEGTDVVCSDENIFVVTVANVQAPTGDATQTITADTAADATIADLQTDTTTGTVTWYASEAEAQAGTNPLAADAQLVQGVTYYATQTVGTCTSEDVFAVTVDLVLDRADFDVKSFTYYPNPVKDVLNLSYSSEITSVTVFNLLGQRVIAQQSNATEVKVDMSALADGAYVVNVTMGNTVKTVKVIKRQ